MLVTMDANIIYGDPFLRGAGAISAIVAADQIGYQLTLTEVVLTEAQGKFNQRLIDGTGKLMRISRELGALGLDPVSSIPSQTERDLAASKYLEALEPIFPKEIRIPIPDIPHQILVQRAICRIRPFKDDDKGYRDTLIWMSLWARLKGSDDSVVLITNDEVFYKDKQTNELHPDLSNELVKDGISPDRFVLYRSLNEFVDDFVSPKLKGLEDIRKGIESGTIKLPENVSDSVGINLWEYSIGLEFDPDQFDVLGAFAAEVDVVEDVSLDEVESAELLPGGDILLRCTWKGEITFIVEASGYQRESVSKPFQASVEMIIKPETYEQHTMDVIDFEIIEYGDY